MAQTGYRMPSDSRREMLKFSGAAFGFTIAGAGAASGTTGPEFDTTCGDPLADLAVVNMDGEAHEVGVAVETPAGTDAKRTVDFEETVAPGERASFTTVFDTGESHEVRGSLDGGVAADEVRTSDAVAGPYHGVEAQIFPDGDFEVAELHVDGVVRC